MQTVKYQHTLLWKSQMYLNNAMWLYTYTLNEWLTVLHDHKPKKNYTLIND